MNVLGKTGEEGETPVIEMILDEGIREVRRDTRNPVGTNNEDHLIRLNTT